MRGWFLLAFASLGCGFQAVPNPLTQPDLLGVDFAGADFAVSNDLSVPPGADLAAPSDLSTATPCNGPLLLVTVENLQNPPQTGGKVVAMSLGDGTNPPAACRTFTAQGLMTPQPFSVAMVGGKLAVEGIEHLQLIDPQNDVIIWSKPAGSTDFPVDVFALKHPDGRDVVAAGWASTGTSPPWAIARVDAWALDGSSIKSWGLNGTDLPLGLSILGMSSYPENPTHLLANDPINHQWAWDVDPWSASKVALFGESSGYPISIYAVMWMTEMRTAWLDSSGNTAVIYNNDANGPSLLGPIACMGCMLLHVVPDPTLNTRFLGLCDGPGVDTRRVVRWKSTGGTCDTVLEGAQYGSLSRLSRLGISQ
jgi:hypothetical protein